MLERLILGLIYIAAVWAIVEFAASTGSIVLICSTAFMMVLGTFWLQRLRKVKASFSTEAQTAFSVLAVAGAVAVVGEISDDWSRYWFAGVVVTTAIASVAVAFFKRETQR